MPRAGVIHLGKNGLKRPCAFTILRGLPTRKALSAQVAQAVERSPEKAGVGGSTPSLGTIGSLPLLPFSSDSPLHPNPVCRFVVANLILVLESQTNIVQSIQQAVAAKLIDVEFKVQSVIRTDAFLS
jgi:hypothetical protein